MLCLRMASYDNSNFPGGAAGIDAARVEAVPAHDRGVRRVQEEVLRLCDC